MTREEAISVLKNTAWIGTDKKVGEVEKAIMMAIEALKAQDVKDAKDAKSVGGDTIYRQDAIDAIDEIESEIADGDGFQYEKWRQYFCELPSAQPEIIRCRACKYWREHKYAKETKRYVLFCGFNAIYTKADDFCSRAERRTDGVDS